MKYSAKSLYKQDHQFLRPSNVRPFDVAYLELFELNAFNETPSDNAHIAQGYTIVRDLDGNVICPDKL